MDIDNFLELDKLDLYETFYRLKPEIQMLLLTGTDQNQVSDEDGFKKAIVWESQENRGFVRENLIQIQRKYELRDFLKLSLKDQKTALLKKPGFFSRFFTIL